MGASGLDSMHCVNSSGQLVSGFVSISIYGVILKKFCLCSMGKEKKRVEISTSVVLEPVS